MYTVCMVDIDIVRDNDQRNRSIFIVIELECSLAFSIVLFSIKKIASIDLTIRGRLYPNDRAINEILWRYV